MPVAPSKDREGTSAPAVPGFAGGRFLTSSAALHPAAFGNRHSRLLLSAGGGGWPGLLLGGLGGVFPLLCPRGTAGGEGSGQQQGSPHRAGTDPALSHLCRGQGARGRPVPSPAGPGATPRFLTAGHCLEPRVQPSPQRG